ncbi:VOC family protein [soil metagenome]
MSVSLNPYLMFVGKAKEAMEFYKTIFGGELTTTPYDEADPNRLMHAELKTDNFVFMASDGDENDTTENGANIKMSLVGDDEETLTKYFNELAEGGKIEQPLTKAPWGDMFGMLEDKFGIHWMMNISAKK